MLYFKALREGQRRVAAARGCLDGITGGRAMPALALADSSSGSWEPVGEESLYAFVDASGFVLADGGSILALVDRAGSSKALVQGVAASERKALEARLAADGVQRYEGRVLLPA